MLRKLTKYLIKISKCTKYSLILTYYIVDFTGKITCNHYNN